MLRQSLESCDATLLIPYPNDLVHLEQKNLSVTDSAGGGGLRDGIDGLFHQSIEQDDFELNFRQEVDTVFVSMIGLRMAFLPTVAAHFRRRHAVNAYLDQGLLHRLKFGGLNNRFE